MSEAVRAAVFAVQDRIAFRIVSSGGLQADISYSSRETAGNSPTLAIESHNGIEERIAIEDAFVRGGAYGNDNYGAEDFLAIKTTSIDWYREGFLKFDISGLSSTAHATLSLPVYNAALSGGSLDHFFYVIDPDWESLSESTLTYNNSRTTGLLGKMFAKATWTSATIASGNPLEVDMTSAVRSAIEAGQEHIAVRIVSGGGANDGVSYTSKEFAGAKPTLSHQAFFVGQSLPSIADTYVRGGIYANENYGDDIYLGIKNTYSNWAREAYLQFDISELDAADHVRLKLPIFNSTVGAVPIYHYLYVVSPDWESHDESTLTWNNSRSSGLQGDLFTSWKLDSQVIANGNPIEVDLTDAVSAAISNRQGRFSIRIVSSASGDDALTYRPRESSGDSPELLVFQTSPSALNAREVIDDSDQGFSILNGQWTTQDVGTVNDPHVRGSFEGNRQVSVPGSGSGMASWLFGTTPGEYELESAFSGYASYSPATPVRVFDELSGRLLLDTALDQSANLSSMPGESNGWRHIGRFKSIGNGVRVELSTQSSGSRVVVADSMRLTPISQLEAMDAATGNLVFSGAGGHWEVFQWASRYRPNWSCSTIRVIRSRSEAGPPMVGLPCKDQASRRPALPLHRVSHFRFTLSPMRSRVFIAVRSRFP